MLVIARDRVNDARPASANSVLVQPASALLVFGLEAKETLERVERRALWVPDRRSVLEGPGRRLTDMGVG